jgi:selenocysteine lyase/cysteine desulfurase
LRIGGYGSPPRAVLDYAQKLTARIEANPDLFLKLELPDLIAEARAKIAPVIGAQVDEVVLTNNASLGLNTVLRNLEWTADDVVIVCEWCSGAYFF